MDKTRTLEWVKSNKIQKQLLLLLFSANGNLKTDRWHGQSGHGIKTGSEPSLIQNIRTYHTLFTALKDATVFINEIL